MESKFNEISFGEEEDEEFFCEDTGASAEDNEFDSIVGALEDILMDESFTNLQQGFCNKHCDIFDNSEENKIEYTPIFSEYTKLIEGLLEDRLKAKIIGFDMKRFESMLVDRQDEVGGEIFDLLLSLGSFEEFKDLMLSYKASKGPVRGGKQFNSNMMVVGDMDGFSLCGQGLAVGGGSRINRK